MFSFLYANKSLDYIFCPYDEYFKQILYGSYLWFGSYFTFWLIAVSSAYTISQLMLIGLIYIFIMLLFSKIFCYTLAFLPPPVL